MSEVAEILSPHPEHRMTTLDRLICRQLDGKPDGLTTLSLVAQTEASMRYVDQRLTELVRAGIVERLHRLNTSGRTITLYALPNSGEALETVSLTDGKDDDMPASNARPTVIVSTPSPLFHNSCKGRRKGNL